MAAIYTDSQVDALVQERKPLPANWKDRARMKAKRGHDEQHLDLTGDAGTGFRLIFRQSKLNRHRCSGFAATTAEATNTPTNISNALSMFRIQDRDGELVLDVPDSRYGDALYSFVQALAQDFRRVLPVARTGEVDLHGGFPDPPERGAAGRTDEFRLERPHA